MPKQKKIALIGTAGVPAKYGGFETLAHNLVEKLNDEFDVHVYASKKIYPKNERPQYWKGARIHYLRLSANGISSILYDFLSMLHAIRYADTLIVLGVSGGLFIPFIRLISRAKIIVNIDGLEWRRDKWSKPVKKFLQISERLAVRYSHADITDNLSIKRYTAIKYGSISHMIAYGADHCINTKIQASDFDKYPFLKLPYAFKVARIEPENNIDLILKAYTQLPNQQLVIVGNWKSSDYGAELQATYNKFMHMHLLDPIYDQTQLNVLRGNCTYYIHGHSAGGTNPSLVEAMFLKLPILSFDVSFNRATTHNKAIFFKNEQELIQRVNQLTRKELTTTAEELYKIAQQEYTWKKIANRYRSLVYLTQIAGFKANYKNYEKNLADEKWITAKYPHLLRQNYNFNHLND